MSNIKYQRFIKGKTDSHNANDPCDKICEETYI